MSHYWLIYISYRIQIRITPNSHLLNLVHSLPRSILLLRILVRLSLLHIRIILSKASNLVPLKREQAIHTLETSTRRLRDEEPSPDTTQDGDNSEQPEGSCGSESTLGSREEHVGHGAGVAVLVDEVETHDHRRGHGTDAQRIDLSVEKILHTVPAHGPSKPRNVDHDDGGRASLFLGLGEDFSLLEFGDGGEVCGDEAHGYGLESDADAEGAFATNDVDEEQGTDDGGDELNDTEDGGCEELLVLAFCAEESEELGGVDGDALGAGPLGEELGEEAEVDAVEVVGHEEHFLEDADPALAQSGFLLLVELLLDVGDLLDDVVVINGEVANTGEVGGCFVVFAALNEVAGGFVVKE